MKKFFLIIWMVFRFLVVKPCAFVHRWIKETRFYGHRLTKLHVLSFLLTAIWSVSWFYYSSRSGDFFGVVLSWVLLGHSVYLLSRRFENTWISAIVHRFLRFTLLVVSVSLSLSSALWIGFWSIYALVTPGFLSQANDISYLVLIAVHLVFCLHPCVHYYWVRKFASLRFLRQFDLGKGGSARFAGPSNLKDKGIRFKWFTGKRTTQVLLGVSLYLYDPFRRTIVDNSDSNILTVATIGSGKSTTTIWPFVSTYLGALIILDPKGEHTKTTRDRRSDKNLRFRGEVFVLAPFGEPEHFYNPLSEFSINDGDSLGYINSIAESIVIEQPQSSSDKYFTEMPRIVIAGFCAHMMSTLPPAQHNLVTLLDMIYGIDEMGVSNKDAFKQLLKDMLANPVAGGIAQRAARDLMSMGDRTYGSVITTISQSMNFVADPLLREHLSKPSDFRFKDIGVGRLKNATVYIQIPFSRMTAQSRWLRMISSMAIVSINSQKKKKVCPTVLLLDEFPQLGKFDIIERAYATQRSAGIKIWTFAQSYAQLKALYGTGANTFVSTSTLMGYGISDMDTAELFSKSLGYRIEEGTPRKLLDESEIMSLLSKDSNRQIILPSSENKARIKLPYLLERCTFLKYRSDFSSYPGHRKYYPGGWRPFQQLKRHVFSFAQQRLKPSSGKSFKGAKKHQLHPS